MKISRRDLFKVSMGAGTALTISSILRAQAAGVDPKTVRMVKTGDLQVFDPIFTTANITADHGAAIYDTLFSVDSKFAPHPQMVEKWSISDDKKTYTFMLRDGLAWHDGSPVTAADCVASIRRWGQVHPGGQLIVELASNISRVDDKTFAIALKEPLGLLIDILADLTPPCLFIMREKDAMRPATEQVTTNIGSGPFKFNEALAKPGASFTYDRNEKYVPRSEVADGLAGGKVVRVDRVIWENISDQQTSLAALQTGEIDFLQGPPGDLYPVIENDINLQLEVLNKGGADICLRMNFLQKPFDNVKARQALLHLIDQEALLRAMAPDAKSGRPVTSIFGNNTPMTNDENTGWYKTGGNAEKAKQLFSEAGYAGEKVVILQPTNVATFSDAAQIVAAALRKIGVNAVLAPSDWGGLVARRANKGLVENGGWNLFITDEIDYSLANPLGTPFLVASGEKAWYGWPKNEEYEALRANWAKVNTLEERKSLARKMQHVWWDFVGDIRLGQIVSPTARRKTLRGVIGMPQIIPMWSMLKI